MSNGVDIKERCGQVQKDLVALTRDVHQLVAEDLGFHRSLDPEVGKLIDKQNARLLETTNRLARGTMRLSDDGRSHRPPTSLRNTEDLDHKWSSVLDTIDFLLERANIALDEFTGILKLSKRGETPDKMSKKPFRKFESQSMDKPQKHFEVVPLNNETEPFRPLLTSKPHAITPLDQSIRQTTNKMGDVGFANPYEDEINEYHYPPAVHTKADPIAYTDLDDTEAIFVEDEEALDNMIKELKTANEIAIDLEHHDQHSYAGIVCLMQISTRDKDWIIDTLKPWRRRLERLNEVFADPKIVKVLHGSHSDVIWLQRDLGVYVVGLFDTYHAARALHYPAASLAYLLERFVNFKASKWLQMSDWRTRPLPSKMQHYARADTHFLLFVYDEMRNQLVSESTPDNDLVSKVLLKSKEEALQRYEYTFYDAERGLGTYGWYRDLTRLPGNLTKEQYYVYKAVHQFRDTLARAEDESPTAILPRTILEGITRNVPTTKAALLKSIGSCKLAVPKADSLLEAIRAASERGKTGPSHISEFAAIEAYIESRAARAKAAANEAAAPAPAPEAGAQAPSLPKPSTALHPASLSAASSTFWGALAPRPRPAPLPAAPPTFVVPFPAQPSDAPGAPPAAPPARPAEPSLHRGSAALNEIAGHLAGRGASNTNLGKRTADAAGLGAGPAPENSAREDEQGPGAEGRKKRKAQQAGREEARDDARGDGNETAEPFDYAAAPSVMNAARAENGGAREALAPFKKALDAPKGLPRKQKEKAGKSATWMA